MKSSDTIGELTKSLAIVQGSLINPKKTEENPFFRSKYADLASVWDACRKPLSDNGLAVIQILDIIDNQSVLVTVLSHVSGEWISSCHLLNPTKNDPQGLGSAITYARRYSLSAIVGVAPEDDDDAEGAVDHSSELNIAATKASIPASDAQKKLIVNLLTQKNLSQPSYEEVDTMTKAEASSFIAKHKSNV